MDEATDIEGTSGPLRIRPKQRNPGLGFVVVVYYGTFRGIARCRPEIVLASLHIERAFNYSGSCLL